MSIRDDPKKGIMDLAEILDVTEPVTVRFMDREVVIHIFTSGAQRLTREEKEILASLEENRPVAPADDLPEGEQKTAQRKSYNASVDLVRAVLPIILKGIELDGSPLTYKGISFPENVASFPDALLLAIGNAALDTWNKANPTSGAVAPTGSELAVMPEQSPAESSIALSN